MNLNIIIDGKQAVLKEGTSFEYTIDNILFTGADSYSMTITLPIKGCAQNIAIFGHVYRRDSTVRRYEYPCTIYCGPDFIKEGTVSIVEIDDAEVKVQFLEGRSSVNYKSDLEETYINEIDLSYSKYASRLWHVPTRGNFEDTSRSDIDEYTEPVSGRIYQRWALSLPWVNSSTGQAQNGYIPKHYDTSLHDWIPGMWKSDVSSLSLQIYLCKLTELILTELDYTYDGQEWEESKWRYLLCYNALPAAWNIKNFATALPHWTVMEYLEQIEHLLNAEFEIDERKKRIRFRFVKNKQADKKVVVLKNVLNQHACDVDADAGTDYRLQKAIKYADCDYPAWRYYSCNDAVTDMSTGGRFDNMLSVNDVPQMMTSWQNNNLVNFQSAVAGGVFDKMIKTVNIDRRWILRVVKAEQGSGIGNYRYYTVPTKVNQFGPTPGENAYEIKIVPVDIEDTDPDGMMKRCVYINCGEYNGDVSLVGDYRLKAQSLIDREEKSTEFIDKIYVGFFKWGLCVDNASRRDLCELRGTNVLPVTDKHYIDNGMRSNEADYYNVWDIALLTDPTGNGFKMQDREFTLHLRDRDVPTNAGLPTIETAVRYKIRWISKKIPDVRSVFCIDNQLYMCEQITTMISTDGASEYHEGTFYKCTVYTPDPNTPQDPGVTPEPIPDL